MVKVMETTVSCQVNPPNSNSFCLNRCWWTALTETEKKSTWEWERKKSSLKNEKEKYLHLRIRKKKSSLENEKGKCFTWEWVELQLPSSSPPSSAWRRALGTTPGTTPWYTLVQHLSCGILWWTPCAMGTIMVWIEFHCDKLTEHYILPWREPAGRPSSSPAGRPRWRWCWQASGRRYSPSRRGSSPRLSYNYQILIWAISYLPGCWGSRWESRTWSGWVGCLQRSVQNIEKVKLNFVELVPIRVPVPPTFAE